MAQVALTKSCLLSSFLILLILWTKKSSAVINLVQSSMYPRENQDLILTCITTNVSEIILWKRNDIDVNYMQKNESKCLTIDGGSGLTVNYKYNCTDNRTYNLVIPRNRIRQENGSKWQCYNADGSSNSKTITLKMASAPTSDPVVTGYNGTILYSGQNTKLICAVQGGTPLATLSWTCGGSNITDIMKSTTTAALSEITLNINGSYNGKRCVCKADHLLWDAKKIGESQIFLVYFAPQTAPAISGYTQNEIIYETKHRNLSCRVIGGNPVTTITWTCRGFAVSAINQSVEGETISTITLNIDREYNNKQCICGAVHPADSYNRQTNVTFTVYYPPSSPMVSNNITTFPWKEEGYGLLSCLSTPGNPSSSFQWKADGIIISGETNQVIQFTNLTKEYNMKQYSCQVFNNFTKNKGQQMWSLNVSLNVEYSPVISVGKTPVNVTEGKEFERECSADGNPKPLINWIYGNLKSALLQFVNTNRNQTGNYTCEAIGNSSKYGELKSQKDLTVIVQFPPTVNVLLSSSIEGQTAEIECIAEGVPDKFYYTKWTQMYGNTVIRTGLFGSLSLENSCLTLTDVSYQDLGVYQCTVHNTIKDRNEILEQYGSAYLDIKFPPVFMPNSPHNYYAELGHKLEIVIPFFSNPFFDNTSIAIIKSDKNYLDLEGEEFSLMINTSSLNLSFHGKNINVNGQKTIFVINSFQEHHTGPYSIKFTTLNDLTSSFKFEVIQSGPPGQPKKITVLSNTKTSITIAWSREFNGGYPQTFVILFKPVNSKEVPMETHLKENDEQDYYNYTLTKLNPGTEYMIWIYSFNYKGNSTEPYDAIEPLKSKTKPERTNGSILNLVIGIVVAIIVIGVIIVAVICLFRRYQRKGEDRKLINNTSNRQSVNDQNSEDVMRDNALYEPAGPNYINPKTTKANVDPSAADIGGKNNDIYSEVRKPGKRQNGQNNTELYPEVERKPKSKTHLSVNSSKTRKHDAGKVYENMETPFNTQESHAKTNDTPRQRDNCKREQEKQQKPPKPKPQKRNKDGLIYIDLILDEPTMDGKQFVIRGLENKTDYAEVDFGRKADPLPPGQDENYNI